MSKIEIKHRSTGAVLWSGEAASLRDGVIAAVTAGANLAGANLAGADLADANLAGADLAGADLADANLADANLARAYLADANLADANLAGADLAGADLADANLADAYLARADLADARNLPDLSAREEPKAPYVRKPNRTRQDYAADYRARHPEVPVVESLDARILDAISQPGAALDMSDWHTCETTHCRAGWAIHLAGKAGYELEAKLGDPALAGRAIYRASTGRSPHFYATTERALADIRRCAEEDAAKSV
jgi:hypothetical protein